MSARASRRRPARLAAALLLGASTAGAQEGSATSAPEAGTLPVPVCDRRLALAEIQERLGQLVLRHPDLAAHVELGRSRAGRPIPLLVLGDRRAGNPDHRPALLFAPERCGPGADHAAELGLTLAWRLAERAAADPAVAALLGERTVYVLPVPDPDGREDGPSADAPAFAASFPLGWWPERLRPGGGSIPLEDPAARAAHSFLEARANLVLLVSLTAEPPPEGERLWAGAVLPAEDEGDFALLAESAGPAALVAWPELTRGGGGFLDYAYQARGIYPVAFVEPPGLAEGVPLAAWLAESAERAEELVGRLPRVELELAALTRLGPGLWQLDLDLGNAGAVSTSSVLARRHGGAPGVTLSLEGAAVIAHAHRLAGGTVFQVESHESGGAGRFEEPALRGGEVRRLRFVVEGSAGAALRLAAASAWCAEEELLVTLPD